MHTAFISGFAAIIVVLAIAASVATISVKRLLFPHRPVIENICGAFLRGFTCVRFRRGYTSTTMLFKCEGITIGKSNPDWGVPKEEVFIIKLGERI